MASAAHQFRPVPTEGAEKYGSPDEEDGLSELVSTSMFEEIVGSSNAISRVMDQILKVAPSDATVLITGESGTGKDLVARATGLRLPALIRDLQIDYTALSLVAPEKVKFRYKLEGHDTDWQDAGTRRQAFYNDLPPRNYRLRVRASNNSGVWNEAGDSLDFFVAPAYYQSARFQASCLTAFLGLLWALHWYRLHQMGGRDGHPVRPQKLGLPTPVADGRPLDLCAKRVFLRRMYWACCHPGQWLGCIEWINLQSAMRILSSIVTTLFAMVLAIRGIASSDLIRLSRRPGLLLCLCLVGGGAVSIRADDHVAAHDAGSKVRINPQAVRLPIVDAVDNRFVRLSTAQGVSQLKVDQIVQDDDGFMWFGTRYGLYRYDGYSFKVFVREDGNPNNLNGVVINALFRGRDGALWVACDQSLNKFDRTTETFRQYPVPYATHITEDTAGMLWVASRNGLYRLDPVSGQIQHYTSDPNDPSSLSGNDLPYCGEDRRGAFWISSSGHLDEFDRKTGKVTRHILIPETLDGFSFYEDRFGVFWIFRSSPNALATLDRETNTLTHYAFPEREPTVTRISAILEDQTGALWMATHGLGLLKLDREHGRFLDYTNISTDPESLPQNKVDALFVDRVGDIWAAPGRMGPAFLASKPPPFRRLPKTPGSTIEPFVGALYEDREGILWIGTPEALNGVDRKIGRTTAYKTGGPAVGTDVVSICEDRSGYLWAGTYGHGLHRFDPRTGKFKTYRHTPADPYSLSNDYVMGLLVDHKGTLWAATGDGLSRFDSTAEHFTVYKPDPPGTAFYRTVIEDQEGKMWLGTESSGLRQFDPATGQLVIYEHNSKLPGSLSDNRINFVHFDRSGTVWVATQNGLDRLDRQTGTFTAFTQRDGLPGNAVGCVLEDNSGNLWMSTNNGVARFNSERKTFSNFSVADGLPGPNLTGWSACFQSPSGEMFFGGFNGGASFFPGKVVDSSGASPIVLTDFRLSGNPVAIGGNSPLRRSISYTRDLILPNQDNVFSITFAALNYSSPAATRYRYRLENLERVWNEVGSDQRQATYTTLPAGTYTFRVQGATRSGPWSEPGVALRIEILPSWWSTRPFQAAVGVLLILIAWAGYRQRVHQVAQRFEARLAERTRIARELHDTLLQGFHGVMFRFQAARNMLPRRPEEAIDALDGALERAEHALAEGRDAIHDLRSSTVVTDQLAQPVTALGQEMSHEVASQDSAHGSARFHVVVEGPPRDLHPILRDEVYAIVREAVRNAFRHAQAHDIEVEISYGGSLLKLRIRDDGKGIDPEIAAEGRAGHYGVPGMRERARRIGGRLDVWTATGAGTEIALSIPASIAYGTSPSRSVLRLFRKKAANS